MAKVRSTDDLKLRAVTATDQHGRLWDVMLDPDTFVPCTQPIPRFHAPLEVPAHVLVFSAEDLGRVAIDYRRWHAEWAHANAVWERDVKAEAQRRFGTLAGDAVRDRLPELVEAVGEPPQAVDFLAAAMAGNRWVLGLPSPLTGAPYATPAWALPLMERIAPRWRQAAFAVRVEDLTIDAARFADEDGASPASAGDVLVVGAQGSAFDDDDDEPLLTGASAEDDDPDGIGEVAGAAAAGTPAGTTAPAGGARRRGAAGGAA